MSKKSSCAVRPLTHSAKFSGHKGAGIPGADAPVAKIAHKCATVTPENTRHPRAMVYGCFVPFPVIGCFATVACGTDRKLDTSAEVPEPHDLAVRFGIARLARRYGPPHPVPRS
jgi:hypothetical protein